MTGRRSHKQETEPGDAGWDEVDDWVLLHASQEWTWSRQRVAWPNAAAALVAVVNKMDRVGVPFQVLVLGLETFEVSPEFVAAALARPYVELPPDARPTFGWMIHRLVENTDPQLWRVDARGRTHWSPPSDFGQVVRDAERRAERLKLIGHMLS